jgi:hypothetical protein
MGRVAACALVVICAGCGQTDDIARASRGSFDDVLRWMDDVDLILLRQADDVARTRAISRINAVADDYELSPELKSALQSLSWDVGCDAATGNLPVFEELDEYIIRRGLQFGLEIGSDAAADIAEELLGAANAEEATLSEVCSELPDTGI